MCNTFVSWIRTRTRPSGSNPTNTANNGWVCPIYSGARLDPRVRLTDQPVTLETLTTYVERAFCLVVCNPTLLLPCSPLVFIAIWVVEACVTHDVTHPPTFGTICGKNSVARTRSHDLSRSEVSRIPTEPSRLFAMTHPTHRTQLQASRSTE